MSADVAELPARTGLVTGQYSTRAEERVWIVSWDDRRQTPPVDLDYADDLDVGCRVRLVGRRLERVR